MASRRNQSNRIAGFFNRLGRLLLIKMRNGDLPMFLVSFVLAFFLWFSQNIGGDLERSLSFEVEVHGELEGLHMTKPVTSPLSVSVSGPGLALWHESRKVRNLVADMGDFVISSNNMCSMPSVRFMDTISTLLPQSVSIKRVYPDSVYFGYEKISKRKLPVRYKGGQGVEDGFVIDKVDFFPDSVQAGLPIGMEDSVSFLYGEISGHPIVSESFETSAILTSLPGVVLYDEAVRAVVKASRVTEKILDVPISGVNFPDGSMLKAFPSKVRISFMVRLSDFNNVMSDDFAAAIDYNTLDLSGDKGEVLVVRQPPGVMNVRVSPMVVDFLIERYTGSVCSELVLQAE